MLPLTRDEKQSLSSVKSYAMKNRLPFSKVRLVFSGEVAPAGNNPKHVCCFQVGKRPYRVAFSVEELPRKMRCTQEELDTLPRSLARHISISSTRTPKVEDINAILQAFDFESALATMDPYEDEKLAVWEESLLDLQVTIGRRVHIWSEAKALNVIEFSNDLSN